MNTALLPLKRPSAAQDAPEAVAVGVAQRHLRNAQRKIFSQLKRVVLR